MKRLTHLMIHCADTPAGRHFDRRDIEQWHLKERGWSRVGYSAIFLLDGTLDILIPFDRNEFVDPWELTNGAAGWNGVTRHVCYIGGKGGLDTRTPQQKAAMATFAKMHAMLWPDVKLIGHNQVDRLKYCPSYNVPDWARSIGVPESCIDSNVYYKPNFP